jgi:hypothetical protein
MTNTLRLTGDQLDQLRTHLLQNRKEQVAFAFAAVTNRNDARRFEAGDLYLASAGDFAVQTEYHVELTEEALAKVIKMAWDKRAALVDFHSHPRQSQNVYFSPSDLGGFADLVPHAIWRLKGQPYVGIVVAPSSTDALVWPDGYDTPEQLDPIVVDGRQPITPTGISFSRFKVHGQRFTV